MPDAHADTLAVPDWQGDAEALPVTDSEPVLHGDTDAVPHAEGVPLVLLDALLLRDAEEEAVATPVLVLEGVSEGAAMYTPKPASAETVATGATPLPLASVVPAMIAPLASRFQAGNVTIDAEKAACVVTIIAESTAGFARLFASDTAVLL